MKTRDRVVVAVCGGQEPHPRAYQVALELGTELGRAGVLVVCGGLGGVMEAVCKGAKSAGGTTVGILPGLDPGEANDWVDVRIATGVGHARNLAVVASADVVVAVDGEFGTLSEIAFALRLGRPVVGLSTWELHPGELAFLAGDRSVPEPLIRRARSPREAVQITLELAASGAS